MSAGCFPKPNRANIELRKEVQTLNDRVAALQSERDAAVAHARAADETRAVQTLPVDRLDKLFTTAGLRFGRIAVGEDLDPDRPGDEGFKISLTPIDQVGDEYKAAGSMTIELFDLAAETPRIGTWTFTTQELRPKWLSTFVIDAYVLSMTWQTIPTNANLTVKATFVDELTGRTFDAQRELTIKVPSVP